MDLYQQKLSKLEWESIEIPVNTDEKQIIEFLKNGFHDVNSKYNNNISLMGFIKIADNDLNHYYLYEKYFKQTIQTIITTYGLSYTLKTNFKKKDKPKKIDSMKMDNYDNNLNRKNIFEYTLIELCENFIKNYSNNSTKDVYHYYTLNKLITMSILCVNKYILGFVNFILETYQEDINLNYVIKNAQDIIEKNDHINKFADVELYNHQKQIFSIFKNNSPKLVLYIAPTATGKTLSPIGLSEKYRIIFVCAARHVGLALAKSALSVGKKIALGFNCKDAEDIRLHFSAAKEYTKNFRTGGIFKVDNSVGDNVEIMICDIKSYLPAMYYMCAFNDEKNIITFWDEPTITMDEMSHPLHSIIQSNWKKNIIPNMVLSSATLPKEEEIHSTIANFKSRFSGEVHSVISHDCKKSISIINKNCEICIPHLLWDNYKEILACVEHCENYKTILRYFDLNEIVKFLIYVNDKKYISNERYFIDRYFSSIQEVNMYNLKIYYLLVLKNLEEDKWTTIYNHFKLKTDKEYDSNAYFITKDAYTLTDGPSIFLAEDINKIAKFCLQQAKIPSQIMKEIIESIEYNNKVNEEIDKQDKLFEDGTVDISEDSKKMIKDRLTPEMKQIRKKLEDLRNSIKSIELNDLFIPNRKEHISKWANGKDYKKSFTCDISEPTVIKIMLLKDVEDIWKILLLMGIGVFVEHKNGDYTQIMKDLAQNQKLFMIIASSNYIYGTNYQFCHGYIGKDLENMTQEKTIQALGRIGRNSLQQSYSIRFRDDLLIRKLFVHEENKPEVINMNKLFNDDEDYENYMFTEN